MDLITNLTSERVGQIHEPPEPQACSDLTNAWTLVRFSIYPNILSLLWSSGFRFDRVFHPTPGEQRTAPLSAAACSSRDSTKPALRSTSISHTELKV